MLGWIAMVGFRFAWRCEIPWLVRGMTGGEVDSLDMINMIDMISLFDFCLFDWCVAWGPGIPDREPRE